MLEGFGPRQQALLTLLNREKAGLTIDEIARELGITRTAVRQHLAALEGEGLIELGQRRETSGRPSQAYRLTGRGGELFPRQYAWFSELMLDALRQERGSEGLAQWLQEIAGAISAAVAPQVAADTPAERVAKTVALMNQLGYAAELAPGEAGTPEIAATNCVYHQLASRFPEVCLFDQALIGRLTDSGIEQHACMVRGDHQCRFALRSQG